MGIEPATMKYEMKYLFEIIFSFPRSGVEKRDVEFRHSTRNAFRIRRKMGNGVYLNTRFPRPTMLCMQRAADCIYVYSFIDAYPTTL